ncbi:MAG: hypothetical protein Q9170_001587 [Blastenia crenularia]
MVRMQEVPRTATFAWSPAIASSLLATGTRAGAVDADFSNDTQLEIWDLSQDDVGKNHELRPIAKVDTDSRFHDLAWAKPSDDHPQGLLAGALENGSLDLWSAEKLLTSKDGPIKALQFNPFRHGLLATAGARGELFISDLNNISNPYRMGNSVARTDDYDCLDWNKNVPHITVTGSSGGFVTVWDVKTKKESLTLNNMGRKAVSAVAWDPNKHTRLVTAIPQDTDPLILVWDLRNANAPERVLRGHDGGVLSLSWCAQDNDLLISCGKDNRTICWNPQTGEAYGEFPVVTNWTFQTRWNPHNPSLTATASFDGKITINPLQSTSIDAPQPAGAPSKATDDVDFFNAPQVDSQRTTFSLLKAPKWMRRPCGASFGFGGKVVSFSTTSSGAQPVSNVRISTFAIDAGIGASTVEFEKAVEDKDLAGICKRQMSKKLNESEKADWTVIETLTSEHPRKELMQYLGFSAEADEAADGISKLTVNGDIGDASSSQQTNGVPTATQNRLSAFFENSSEGDSFLSDLAATKGAKINNPFHIYSGSESEPDRRITRALLLGQYDKALDICLQEDRVSDAFMVAICGGQSCIEKAQKAFFNRKSEGPNYLRLLASVVGKDLWDIVYNANLANWREIMATVCTYAAAEEFPDLCETLGDRLDEQARASEGTGTLRQDASFCYLAGSKLEKVVGIWILELEQHEKSDFQETDNDSSFGIHARSLQHFIEKVTVFREATNFQDKDLQATSKWKLSLLYDKYTEYADLLASFGQLRIAERYLDLLPRQYPSAETARERIKQATRAPLDQKVAKQPPNVGRAPRRNQPAAGHLGMETESNWTRPMQNSSNPYGPTPTYQASAYPQPAQASYKPPGYADSGKYGPPQQPRQPPLSAQVHEAPYTYQSLGPSPKRISTSQSIPAPSKAPNMGNWNDMPDDFFKPPNSRRGTPGVPTQSTNAPYGYPPAAATPGMLPPPGAQQKSVAPLPPPPKGPPRASSPFTGTPPSRQAHDRPPSSATSGYAPQQALNQVTAGQQQPTVPRGTSPYNPPPSAAPPSNRYAPSSNTPKDAYPSSGAGLKGPPPANPYAPQPNYGTAQPRNSNERMEYPTATPATGPPPRSSDPWPLGKEPVRAEAIQSQHIRANTTDLHEKHPPGDRSHIPTRSRPIFELLSSDMQRVKARAPANFQKHVNDAEKRLNMLFDHLNNEDLLKEDTVASMVRLSQALQARDYEQAQSIHVDLIKNRTDQCGQWMLLCHLLRSRSSFEIAPVFLELD